MKNSLYSISIAAILVSTSVTTVAGPVTIPNTFTAGTPAVAAEVNGNFSAVEAAVDGNAGDITTNAGNITTNAADIATNEGNITTNAGNIATNAAAITALQGGSTCPSDMVAVGSLCVDLYEAILRDAAGGAVTAAFCNADGSDCGDGLATAIYASSEPGVTPTASATWYQANQACANVGKRLPTTAEWVMAASGTDETLCPNAALAATGASPACVSTAGAFDMVGNLWEWAADGELNLGANNPASTDDLIVRVLGSGYVSGGGSTKSMFLPTSRVLAANPEFGIRCVR